MDNLPEAPLSVTFKLAYKGIEVLATKRKEDAKLQPYLESAKLAIDWALSNGFEVPVRAKFSKPVEYVEGRLCPTCQNKLVYATKKDGVKFIKCSTNKWINGQSTGCPFVEWPNTANVEGQSSAEIGRQLQ